MLKFYVIVNNIDIYSNNRMYNYHAFLIVSDGIKDLILLSNLILFI
jgi:hypothetical protein